MAWVSTPSRRRCRPASRSDSQTVAFHSIAVWPQMSLTSTSSRPCSASMRSTSSRTSSAPGGRPRRRCPGRRRRRPAQRSPRSSRAGPSPTAAPRVDRPVQYTVAPAAPSCTAIPRPAPRVAPATRATLPDSGPSMGGHATEPSPTPATSQCAMNCSANRRSPSTAPDVRSNGLTNSRSTPASANRSTSASLVGVPPRVTSTVSPGSRPARSQQLGELRHRGRQLVQRVVHRHPARPHRRGPPKGGRAVAADVEREWAAAPAWART